MPTIESANSFENNPLSKETNVDVTSVAAHVFNLENSSSFLLWRQKLSYYTSPYSVITQQKGGGVES